MYSSLTALVALTVGVGSCHVDASIDADADADTTAAQATDSTPERIADALAGEDERIRQIYDEALQQTGAAWTQARLQEAGQLPDPPEQAWTLLHTQVTVPTARIVYHLAGEVLTNSYRLVRRRRHPAMSQHLRVSVGHTEQVSEVLHEACVAVALAYPHHAGEAAGATLVGDARAVGHTGIFPFREIEYEQECAVHLTTTPACLQPGMVPRPDCVYEHHVATLATEQRVECSLAAGLWHCEDAAAPNTSAVDLGMTIAERIAATLNAPSHDD